MNRLHQALEWCMAQSKTWAFGVGPRGGGHALWLRVGVHSVEIPLPKASERDWSAMLLKLTDMMRSRHRAQHHTATLPIAIANIAIRARYLPSWTAV